MTTDTKNKAHCNFCGGDRTHLVLHSEVEPWSEDDSEYGKSEGVDTYDTLKCAGCGAVKLRHQAITPWYESTGYFPAATFRRRPHWWDELLFDLMLSDDSTPELHNEIYVALQHGLHRIAAMGVRALLEQIMIKHVGDKGTFGKNLTAFEANGYVTNMQKERLSTIIEAGHAAAHRGFNPSREDVITLLDIAEHVIETLYVHEPKLKKLKERVPVRPERKSE